MNEMLEMHAILHGQVQGVGCRATVRYHAIQLGLSGTVCNLPNNTVEIFAQGPKQALETLLEHVKKALGEESIAKVDKELYPPQQFYSSFSIIYSPKKC